MPSLTEAIDKKYESDNFTTDSQDFVNIVIFAPKKQQNGLPVNLILNEYDINSAGDLEKLLESCQNVEELDLSHNKLKDWEEISKIVEHIPQLKFLNLGFNDLSKLQVPKSIKVLADNLEKLALVKTGINWDSVWKMLAFFPSLKELYLSKNEFDIIPYPEEKEARQLKNIEKLMFNENLVSDWSQIMTLGKMFPPLTHLSLSNCPLRLENWSEDCEHLRNLKVLNLSSTLVASHQELSRLNDLPNLKEIRLSGIPFLQTVESKERRQELIALLPNIKKLNGGADITSDEREAAERFVIRKYLDAEIKPLCYSKLVEKHGQLKPLYTILFKPVTKIKLKIKFDKIMEIEQEVNLLLTLNEFKKSLEPLVGLTMSRMELYHLDLGLPVLGQERLLRNNKLYTYHLNEGDEIYVEVKTNSCREVNQN